ncbi:MAG: diacylglycerol kinase family lipid kinase [Chlorobi bacterium]|nr:diacylglycerol kinase family lipid kinase [Chlorobiota bacterium]
MTAVPKPKKKICFIVNPLAGGKKTAGIVKGIEQNIDPDLFEYEVRLTERAGHASELSREALARECNIIVAVGGDGTINEVAKELIRKEATLGIIPLGSGNGLARHLGIPRHISGAVRLLNKANHILIDTAEVNGHPFVSIAGVGFDALVAKEFASNKKRGFITYFNIIRNRFINYKPKKYTLVFDEGMKICDRAFFISFANSNQFGYNTTIAPNARLNDGLLDVCIVKKPKLPELPVVINLLLLKRVDLAPGVTIVQSKGLTVKRKKARPVNIDGEAVMMGKKLRVEINPLSLKVIIPENE